MKSENFSVHRGHCIENELDIANVFRAFWRGKVWIVGLAILFAILAFIYTLFAEQQWSATAVTDKPSVDMLGNFYLQKQFIISLDNSDQSISTANIANEVTNEVYNEFIVQLNSYDNRRNFWLNTDYYKSRLSHQSYKDSALLEKLIKQIKFTPRDDKNNISDSLQLTAETAIDANQLLRQYIVFVSQKTAEHMTQELKGLTAARVQLVENKVKKDNAAVQISYQQELANLEKALAIAKQLHIIEPTQLSSTMTVNNLPYSDWFLLGQSILEAKIASLKTKSDISNDVSLQQLLVQLEKMPFNYQGLKPYRYLRTPEEPIKRDSPRRTFLMTVCGIIGIIVGAGVALVRYKKTLA